MKMIHKRSLLLGLVVLLAACGGPTGPTLHSSELAGARSLLIEPVDTTESAASEDEEETTSATTDAESDGTTEARGGGYVGSGN
jgi:ABC-type glycerol-3-phosphate transport system substrate-binding protein